MAKAGEFPREESGYFVVPGHWRGGTLSNFMLNAKGARVATWKGTPVPEYSQAWYRRTFSAPSDWRGREVRLDFEHLRGLATVYVNGREAGRSSRSSGWFSVAVEDLLEFGKENELRVFLEAVEDPKDPRAGIVGDSWLSVRPRQGLGLPELRTSFRRKQLTLKLPAQNIGTQISLRVLGDGKQIAATQWPASSECLYEFSWMPGDRLWSPESPEILSAEIELSDAKGKVLDQVSVPFGFREFWIEGGDFFLNNRRFVLKADSALPTVWSPDWVNNDDVFRDEVALARKMNLNALMMPPETPARLYTIADELGILILQKGLVRTHQDRDRAAAQPDWWESFEDEVKQTLANPTLRNHPSIIAWIIDVWYNFHSGTATPEYIGMEAETGRRLMLDAAGKSAVRDNVLDPNIAAGIPAARKEHLDRVIALCRKYAPEYEFFTNGSGHAGNVFSTHIYHTWGAPRAELSALFERWKQERTLPIYAGEIALPYVLSFYDLEKAQNGGAPYFLENGARIFGNEAYRFQGVSTLKPFHDQTDDGVFANMRDAEAGGIPNTFMPEIFLQSVARFTESLFPSWRADGFSGFGTFGYVREGHWVAAGIPLGSLPLDRPDSLSRPGYTPQTLVRNDAITLAAVPGMEPAQFRLNVAAPPLRRAMDDLTLIVRGPQFDPYLNDHAYFGGDSITKTLVVANDTSVDASGRIEATLATASGRVLKRETFPLEVKSGGLLSREVSFESPQVAARGEFRLKFELFREGVAPLREQRAIQVFPRQSWSQPKRDLSVFDPEGVLLKQLRHAGITFQAIEGLSESVATGILLVGRNALSTTSAAFDPNAYTAKGVSVLVLEQRPEVSAELSKVRQRDVHIQSPEHPLLAGLKDVDFTNWSGGHGNSPAFAPTQTGAWWSDWGNRNTVATSVFRRPYAGNLTSPLVCGFDLFQTPLIECRGREATWIACQLDLTDRLHKDPVPTVLMQRLLSYLDNDGGHSAATALISRTPKTGLLHDLKADITPLEKVSMERLAPFETVIVHNADLRALASEGNTLADFVYWGGRVIYLHDQPDFESRWLPFPMRLGMRDARQALVRNPGWNLGWNNNDLYWRDLYQTPIFEGFPTQFEATDPAVVVRHVFGSGEYWFVSITPTLFKDTAATAKTVRLISNILGQNNVAFLRQENPFRPSGKGMTIDLANRKWEFKVDPQNVGSLQKWETDRQTDGWQKGLIADGVEVRAGVPWESFLKENYDGVAWYRLNVRLPSEGDLYLNLGPIDDFDQTYFNGTQIGETDERTKKWWDTPRTYRIPKELIRPDSDNLISVRVEDKSGIGGIKSGPVTISEHPPLSRQIWTNPYPKSSNRDYLYDPDVVRMY
ncbi:MAG: sugar-binding domain-containing protein [Terrimicrobiaceae bacterium]